MSARVFKLAGEVRIKQNNRAGRKLDKSRLGFLAFDPGELNLCELKLFILKLLMHMTPIETQRRKMNIFFLLPLKQSLALGMFQNISRSN
jgi:hypothetical protein